MLRTGSYPADINQLQSHTAKSLSLQISCYNVSETSVNIISILLGRIQLKVGYQSQDKSFKHVHLYLQENSFFGEAFL